MNDRFKFRMWNRSSKSYVDSDTYGLSLYGELFYFSPSEDGVHLSECEDYTIIEQCTGLKDKNGVLIYEGDIVRFRSPNTNCDLVVRYSEQRVQLNLRTITENKTYWCPTFDSMLIRTYELEIIGNIHENPELLETPNA